MAIKNKIDTTNVEQKKTEWGIVYIYRGDNYMFNLYVYNDDMKTMYLSSVRVNPTARKRGIGNDILVTAENEAKKYGADNILLVVSKSSWVHDWYKRHGFVDFKIDKYKDYIWMQKQINQNEKDHEST